MKRKYIVLAGILAVLVIIYVLSEISFKSSQTTFDPDILKIDSAEIAEVIMIPSQGDSVFMIKNGDTWKLESGNLTTVVSTNGIGQLLGELGKFRIDRLASDSEADLEKYQLTDSLKSQIIVKNAEKETIAHLLIGKVSFNPRMGQGMYGGQQSVDGITYFCIEGDNTIYAASSFLGMMLTLPVDNWREHIIAQCEPAQIRKVTLRSNESSFVLSKDSTGWKLDGSPADSAAAEQFVNGLAFQALSSFTPQPAPGATSDYTLQIESVNQTAVTITGSLLNDSTILIKSSLNPEFFTAGKNEPLIQNYFLKKKEDLLKKK